MNLNSRGCWHILLLVLFALPLALLAGPRGVKAADGSTLITMDADGTSLNDILRILADRSGQNIVMSPEVQDRKITIHLRGTPFDEALNLVVRASGLGYEKVGNSILVAEVATLENQTGLMTRIFHLNFVSANDVCRELSVLSKDVASDPQGNQVIVRGSQSTLEEVEEAIRQLDVKPKEVLLEARLIEVNTTSLLELGIDWEKITKWTTVVTEGNPQISRTGEKPENSGYKMFTDGGKIFRQNASLDVALDALLTDGNARLLSNSKLVTTDNTPAEIFAGETVPVVITSLQTPGGAGGVFQTVQLEKIDVGVKLQITPRTSEDGFVTVLVQPEVSRIEAFVGPDNDLPQTSTRRLQTLVRVRDGEKIYLGGLISEEKRSTVKRVPLLGRIPILGHFFSHYHDETVRLDLVVEITPRVVGDVGAALPAIEEPTNEMQK